jgi:hypothetical protein
MAVETRGWTALVECPEYLFEECVSGQATDSDLCLAHPGLDHRVVVIVERRIIAESVHTIRIYREVVSQKDDHI